MSYEQQRKCRNERNRALEPGVQVPSPKPFESCSIDDGFVQRELKCRWKQSGGGMENDRFQQLLSELARPPGKSSGIRKHYQSGRPSQQLVYVVDDDLCELYRMQLEAAGYEAKAFTDRAVAWTAFLREDPKPALLITDYVGLSMSAERLMQRCRSIHPGIKILMVSFYGENCLSSCRHKPDRFLHKGEIFSNGLFLDEVQSLIANAE